MIGMLESLTTDSVELGKFALLVKVVRLSFCWDLVYRRS
jgi:hypothetical protein